MPYFINLAAQISDPTESSLTLLARGLLRRLISEEEAGIGEELGVMGCRQPGLRVVGFEMPRKDRTANRTQSHRQVLYRKGGLISVTSRILAVDMLLSDIPINMITGIIVMHAEKLYRAKNQAGFLKAFSDQPEHIRDVPFAEYIKRAPALNLPAEDSDSAYISTTFRTSSLTDQYSFHEEIQKSLEPRKADVYELAQPMSESMSDIHEVIVNCMNATLNELKRSNTTLDLDELDIKSAYFRSFDFMVRRQLDPIWNRVGARTKRLIMAPGAPGTSLLMTLSRSMRIYLETIVASKSSASSSIYPQENQSPWLTMDAANTIFTVAKRLCYFNIPVSDTDRHHRAREAEQDAGWEVLDEIEGVEQNGKRPASENSNEDRPWWLPEDISPILEEPPKWNLLAETLHEFEEAINDKPGSFLQPGSDTVLVMSSSNRTCALLRECLDMLDLDAPKGEQGRPTMMRRLRGYLGWKADLHVSIQNHANANHPSFKRDAAPILNPGDAATSSGDGVLSEAMKKKDRDRRDRAANRRRVRGCAPPGGAHSSSSQRPKESEQEGLMKSRGVMIAEAEPVVASRQIRLRPARLPPPPTSRRIEVYRNANPGLGVLVYFLFYAMNCEEQKYLARGSMLMPIMDERRSGTSMGDAIVRTISSRITGGGKVATTAPSQVIVDKREFWSTLPNMLHASRCQVLIVAGCAYTPILLIEFEESRFRSRRLQRSNPTGKYPKKPAGKALPGETPDFGSVQSKLVLLALSFPACSINMLTSFMHPREIYAMIKGHKDITSTPWGTGFDVRDVATAHVNAIVTGAAGGERFIVASGPYTNQGIIDAVHDGTASDAVLSALPKGTPGSGKEGVHPVLFDTTKARTVLGMKFRQLSETAQDTARSSLANEKSFGWRSCAATGAWNVPVDVGGGAPLWECAGHCGCGPCASVGGAGGARPCASVGRGGAVRAGGGAGTRWAGGQGVGGCGGDEGWGEGGEEEARQERNPGT
ncbi:hypothetical protein JB92DRAFT_2825304 [Gautieria morchelliformis]|nr:hypothetical protein JB92DRAFT_2825304 [Gautieria morchelliformis]